MGLSGPAAKRAKIEKKKAANIANKSTAGSRKFGNKSDDRDSKGEFRRGGYKKDGIKNEGKFKKDGKFKRDGGRGGRGDKFSGSKGPKNRKPGFKGASKVRGKKSSR